MTATMAQKGAKELKRAEALGGEEIGSLCARPLSPREEERLGRAPNMDAQAGQNYPSDKGIEVAESLAPFEGLPLL